MLRVEVNFKDDGARAGIAAVVRACNDKQGLHQAMAQGVELGVREHLTGLNSRSPNTNFYARAAKSTEVEADGAQGLVRITQRGMALRYYGGRVVPGKSISSFTGKETKALAIPSKNVPLAGREGRKGPREMGLLAFLPSKKPGTIGVLIEGAEKAKKKGGTRIVPKDGGRLMYVLRSWTDHKENPALLPTLSDLIATASNAAEDFIAATTNEEPLT